MPLTANYSASPEQEGRPDPARSGAGEDRLSPEDWYDLIVQASSDGSWFFDIDNGAIHYSPSFLDTIDFDADKGALTPEEFMERVHPDDRERYKRVLGQHLKGETDVFQAEIRVFDDAGKARWILSRGIARRGKDGRAYCMFGSIVDITRRKMLEESLRAVALSTGDHHAGTEFFESSVRYLAQTLNCDYAVIGRLDQSDTGLVETVAVYKDGAVSANFRYELADTPCEKVVEKKTCVYPDNVARLFPLDSMLADEHIEAYVGSPLLDSSGRAIGVILALFRRPLTEPSMAEDLLKIFGGRAAAELERVSKEQELARSEQRYRELYHRTPVMLHSIDREGRLLAVSEYWLNHLGYESEEQVLGKQTSEFLTESSRRYAVEEILPDFFRTGICRNVPYQVVKSNGEVIDVLLSAVAEYDEQGQIDRSLAVMVDVTEQRRVEAQYRDIFDNAPEGIYRSSPDGRLMRANPALVRMHGYETESELIESMTDIASQWYVDPEERARLTQLINRFDEVRDHVVEIYRRATGERRWVIENAWVVRDENGRVSYYEGTIHDITERRRLEAEYRDIFDNVGEGIYRSTPDGKLVQANPALARLQGFDTPEKLMAAVKNLDTDWYVDPGARRELGKLLAKQGYVDGFEAEVRKLAGDERIWTSETVRVTRDPEGNVQYYEGMVRNITVEVRGRELALHRNTILELIARDAPLESVLREIAAIADKQYHYLSASILLLQDGCLRSAAASSGAGDCFEDLDGKTPAEIGGAVLDAIRGERDAEDDRGESAGDVAGPAGDKCGTGNGSVVANPVRDQQGAVLGVIAACTQNGRRLGATGREALREMAQMASIAIEQHRLSEALRLQAHYDSLTGLPNRVLLSDRLEQAIHDADRIGYAVSVLLLDLDEFKLVNDSLGHSAGDRLLQEVAARLRDCLRAGDTIARLGGDEFVLVVPLKQSVEACADVAERLMATLQKDVHVAGREVKARPSIGISLYPHDGRTPEALLQAADTAMYAAKNAGKNQYRYFAESMNRQVSERLRIESELHDAIRNDELSLHYQPRVTLGENGEACCGAEALLRWHHPRRGLLSAFEFIGIAERGPLISDIDRIVLRMAAERLAEWQRAGHDVILSVNISARELHADGFAAQVALTLEEAGVHPSGFELEITENVLMRDYERTRRQLVDLKARAPGLRIAIDDFGSGYSSLNYLRELPIDTLKIDRSFVTDLGKTSQATAGAIAKTIVDLGRNLGLIVVAEGVETEMQAECLRRYGCHQAQGFLYDKPLPSSEFEHRYLSPQP